jgi:xylulokinase
MTGQLATDVGDASGTLLFNPATRNWNLDVAAAFNLPSSLLPPVLESGDIAGRLTPHAAAALGLPPHIPVVAGSGDNMMGAIGAGVVAPGMAVLTIGTSGAYTAGSALANAGTFTVGGSLTAPVSVASGGAKGMRTVRTEKEHGSCSD